LQSHPSIFIPSGEIATFEDPQYADFEVESFLSLFEEGQDAEAIGLKRPNYLHESNVPPRLVRHLPDLRLIAILRDPVRRAISAYYHQVHHGFAPAIDINQGLLSILNGRWKQKYPRTSQIIAYGKYGTHLDRFAEHFDRNQLFLTTHRAVKESPLAVAQSIGQFLQIDSRPDEFTLPPGKSNAGVYSMTRLRWIRFKNPIRFDYFYDGQRLEPRTDISRFEGLVLRLIDKIDRDLLQPVTDNSPPQLSTEVRERLIDFYRKDVEALRTNYDLDIRHWSVFTDAAT
jgi:hypothetical protein